jgi:hypothetical protein
VNFFFVIPAKAGIRPRRPTRNKSWIPVFAGAAK